MKEGENQREMELWAALEKKEAEEEEKREEGEKEEEEEGEKEEAEKELKGRGSVERGKTHQAVATITFSHTAGPDTGPSISVRQHKSHTHIIIHHVNQPYHNSGRQYQWGGGTSLLHSGGYCQVPWGCCSTSRDWGGGGGWGEEGCEVGP